MFRPIGRRRWFRLRRRFTQAAGTRGRDFSLLGESEFLSHGGGSVFVRAEATLAAAGEFYGATILAEGSDFLGGARLTLSLTFEPPAGVRFGTTQLVFISDEAEVDAARYQAGGTEDNVTMAYYGRRRGLHFVASKAGDPRGEGSGASPPEFFQIAETICDAGGAGWRRPTLGEYAGLVYGDDDFPVLTGLQEGALTPPQTIEFFTGDAENDTGALPPGDYFALSGDINPGAARLYESGEVEVVDNLYAGARLGLRPRGGGCCRVLRASGGSGASADFGCSFAARVRSERLRGVLPDNGRGAAEPAYGDSGGFHSRALAAGGAVGFHFAAGVCGGGFGDV